MPHRAFDFSAPCCGAGIGGRHGHEEAATDARDEEKSRFQQRPEVARVEAAESTDLRDNGAQLHPDTMVMPRATPRSAAGGVTAAEENSRETER